VSVWSDPTTHLHAKQLAKKALDVLSERDRCIVTLHWVDGFSFREISEQLGMSRSAAKVAAFRAYGRMRNAVAPESSAFI